VPSLPINSKMTGQFIGLPRSGVISLAHTAPGETVSCVKSGRLVRSDPLARLSSHN